MDRTMTTQWTYFRRLMLLASIAMQLSCKPQGSEIEVELDAGKQFTLTVKNRSEDFLDVDDRLFASATKSPVNVEVARADGTVIAPCSYLDYVGSGSRLSLPPDEEAILSVTLTALTATRCLAPNEHYVFRALLVSGEDVVSRTEWMPFRAVSLE